MATKRIASHSINWTTFGSKVPKQEIKKFNAFKAKSDGYVVKVSVLPEAIPQINWAMYEGKVPVAGMIENFKKSYEALTIPYPADTYSAAIDAEETEATKEGVEFMALCRAEIAKMEAELKVLSTMPPPSEMTIEEFYEAFPQYAIDSWDKPTVWPHTEESQPDYFKARYEAGLTSDH